MIDMFKEMRALERRYHEEQIAECDRWAAEATTERSRKQWQGLADSFREMGEEFFGMPMPMPAAPSGTRGSTDSAA